MGRICLVKTGLLRAKTIDAGAISLRSVWCILVGPSAKTREGTIKLQISIPLLNARLLIRVRTPAPTAIENNQRTNPIIVTIKYHVLGLFLTVMNLYQLTINKPSQRKNRKPKKRNANIVNKFWTVVLSNPTRAY